MVIKRDEVRPLHNGWAWAIVAAAVVVFTVAVVATVVVPVVVAVVEAVPLTPLRRGPPRERGRSKGGAWSSTGCAKHDAHAVVMHAH